MPSDIIATYSSDNSTLIKLDTSFMQSVSSYMKALYDNLSTMMVLLYRLALQSQRKLMVPPSPTPSPTWNPPLEESVAQILSQLIHVMMTSVVIHFQFPHLPAPLPVTSM